MMKENFKNKMAKIVESKAIDIVKNTVGKSVPYSVHEVKVPAELKKADLENMTL